MEAWDSAESWRSTMEHSHIGMALLDLDGRIMMVNRASCDFTGYDAASLLRRGFRDITHPDDLDPSIAVFGATSSGVTESHRIEKRYMHADGHIIWGDVSASLVRDREGRPLHVLVQIIDVTKQHEQQKRLEAALAEIEVEQQTLTALFETVSVGLLLIDKDGRYVRMNRSYREAESLAFPQGHHGQAGQDGETYLLDGTTKASKEDMPTYRASHGEEFDEYTFWVGADPSTRKALSVSARQVLGSDGDRSGSALVYQDITALHRASLVQDKFVSSVSHELRTPLTSMLGYLEMMNQQNDVPPKVAAQLQIVERNAVRLRTLLSDLLQVGQAQEGGLAPKPARTNLVGLAKSAIEASRPLAEKHGVVVDLQAPATLTVVIDKRHIRQVLDNLLSNGIKYTPAGGRVIVVLRQTRVATELEVTDTGIGITADEMPLVFDRFFRGNHAFDQHVPGTGLGLNIVRSIVTAHGGDITLDSKVGHGSTFRVTLPHPAT